MSQQGTTKQPFRTNTKSLLGYVERPISAITHSNKEVAAIHAKPRDWRCGPGTQSAITTRPMEKRQCHDIVSRKGQSRESCGRRIRWNSLSAWNSKPMSSWTKLILLYEFGFGGDNPARRTKWTNKSSPWIMKYNLLEINIQYSLPLIYIVCRFLTVVAADSKLQLQVSQFINKVILEKHQNFVIRR